MRKSSGDQSVRTVTALEKLLAETSSPSPLLRPHFWRMRPDKFCRALSTQFFSSGSADEVYPNILVGNKGAAENTDLLTELGISHLLNCAGGARRGNILTGSGKVRPELGGRNIEYKELALRDTPGENILSVLDDTTDWMERVVADQGRILVNCFVGSSRSATVTVAFLMKHRNFTLEQSLVTIKQRRDIKPNRGFLNQLIEYEKMLQTARD